MRRVSRRVPEIGPLVGIDVLRRPISAPPEVKSTTEAKIGDTTVFVVTVFPLGTV
jgi:hypothetical protein